MRSNTSNKSMMVTHALFILKIAICHIFPVLATVVLLVLNIRGHYIGGELSGRSGEDEWKFFGLHVATMGFVLLIFASIWQMYVYIINPAESQTPFHSSVEEEPPSISPKTPLISTQHIPADGTASKRATTFLAVLFMSVVLLAPRATLPELRNWEAGGTTFWLNATLGDMWPSRLETGLEESRIGTENSQYLLSNAESIGNLLSYWRDPTRKVMPEQANVLGMRAVRKLLFHSRGPFDYQPPITAATIPASQIADALSELAVYWAEANTHNCVERKTSFCYYNDIKYSVDALQPVVFAKCNPNEIGIAPSFPRLDRGPDNFPLVVYDDKVEYNRSTNSSTLQWVKLPEFTFGLSSIGVFVPTDDQILACTIDARWANAKATISYSEGPMVVSGSPKNWFTTGRDSLPMWSQVELSLDWARQNTPIFHLISSDAATTMISSNSEHAANIVEGGLAMMLAESMSLTASNAAIQGSLSDSGSGRWINEIMPSKGAFGKPGNAFEYSSKSDGSVSQITMEVRVNGFGYGRVTKRIPALGVLSLYLAVVSLCWTIMLRDLIHRFVLTVYLTLRQRPLSKERV